MAEPMIQVRRSVVADVPAVKQLVGDEEFMFSKRYEKYNLHYCIEGNFLAVTATDLDGEVLGFASFNDFPTTQPDIPSTQWEPWLKAGWLVEAQVEHIKPCNSLWMVFFASRPTMESHVLNRIVATVFTTLPQVDCILYAQRSSTPDFAPVATDFMPLEESGVPVDKSDTVFHNVQWKGKVLVLDRVSVIPDLILRQGAVEDYDDLMPLIEAGEGVVTPCDPKELFLEELLQHQDNFHSVIVAQDAATNAIVGLACLSATYESQQYLVKQYATDAFNKLKPQFAQAKQGAQQGHNVFQIDFFYLNPEYDNRSQQLLPYMFDRFPFAEYGFIHLPHAAPEHPILHDFIYTPIRKFQPSNVQGERLPLPQGLWLCSRYSLEPVALEPIKQAHEVGVQKMMSGQGELSRDLAEAMCLACTQSIPVGAGDQDASTTPFSSHVAIWRDQVIGVVITRHVTMKEMYSLQENFDLAASINFTPNGDGHYGQTDIFIPPEDSQSTYFRNDMPGVVIKHFYVKPIFRCRMRFLLREAMRYTKAQVVLHVASTDTETYSPLLAELMITLPRRIIDQSAAKDASDEVDSLVVLHHSSRKALSDEKTKIHARIVVIGSGTTGIAFIYNLLKIPYLHFSNIVLVSQDGFPDHPLHRDLVWTVDTMDWMEREYVIMKIGKKIRLIEGTMIDFDRADKYIFTDNACCEPYDHLIITAGRQYAIPKNIISQHGAKNGVFPLSNTNHTNKIKQHIHESEIYEDEMSNAVIYGSSLDVYCIATCVIQLGLAPQRVAIVSPEPAGSSVFGDPLVDMKIEKLLEAQGVKVHRGFALERLEYDEDNNLTSVIIAARSDGQVAADTRGKAIEVQATMFIYAHEKDIDAQILSALNKRSIVFDGRVIIETSYRTTDDYIYAAGPVAMFSRRFGPSDEFEKYSALEVGQRLCETVLGFLGVDEFMANEAEDQQLALVRDDPLAAELGAAKNAENEEKGRRRRPKPLPQYNANVTRRVDLPSGYMFFQCFTTNYQSVAQSCRHISSSSQKGDSYVRISIGPNKYIECITYFGNEEVGLYNLRSLVGLPESVLNILYNHDQSRNQHGDSTLDIIEYLRSSWAHAIFFDKFQALFTRIKEKLAEHPEVQQVEKEIMECVERDGVDHVSEKERAYYHKRLARDNSDARHLVELELIKFLHENKQFVPPLYFLPDIEEHLQT